MRWHYSFTVHWGCALVASRFHRRRHSHIFNAQFCRNYKSAISYSKTWKSFMSCAVNWFSTVNIYDSSTIYAVRAHKWEHSADSLVFLGDYIFELFKRPRTAQWKHINYVSCHSESYVELLIVCCHSCNAGKEMFDVFDTLPLPIDMK